MLISSRVLVFLVPVTFIWIVVANSFAVPPSETLTAIASIRELSPNEADRGLEVRVRGVILYSTLSTPFVIMDDMAIWCQADSEANRLELPRMRAGDIVEVEGRSRSGHGASIIHVEKARVIDHGLLPTPQAVTFPEMQSGILDCQWVTINGVVQSVKHGRLMSTSGASVLVSVFGGKILFKTTSLSEGDVEKLIDSEVAITGICHPRFNYRGDYLGSDISSSDSGGMRITRVPPRDPFAGETVTIDSLLEFTPKLQHQHRQIVSGTVTACEAGVQMFITEDIRNLRIYPETADTFVPGDVVQCSGFAEIENDYPVLRAAVVRKIGCVRPPQPRSATVPSVLEAKLGLENLLVRDFEACLIKLRGQLVAIEDRPRSPFQLIIETDGVLVPAIFSYSQSPEKLRGIRLGSTLDVTGVCSITNQRSTDLPQTSLPKSFELMIRSAHDVSVVSAATWWTVGRLATALACTLSLLVGSIMVIEFMRRRISIRGTQLAEAMRLRRDLEIKTAATLRERERIAADLHDTLEQSLAGVALQLHATRVTSSEQVASRNLDLADRMLNRSREDLRRSVWNLRSPELEAHFLREALGGICETLFDGTDIFFEVAGDGAERELEPSTADNLLLVAKEAVTNSIKHANPERIRITVDYAKQSVTLSISDDGSGFDPTKVAGAHDGHFGLIGIQDRVSRIGGELAIQSGPDGGTHVVVKVPG